MNIDPTSLVSDLMGGSSTTRGAALLTISARTMRGPGVLAAVLACTSDTGPAPSGVVPARKQDPFADFFGGDAAAAPAYTVGELASDKLVEAHLPGSSDTLRTLAGFLAERDDDDNARAIVARLLGVIAWNDEVEAVRTLLPPLLRSDTSLFEALPGLKEPGLTAAVELALRPVSRRAINELLNHPVAGEICHHAVRDALCNGQLDEPTATLAELLALLSSWPGAALVPAQALCPTEPWAVLFQAFDDEGAHADLAAWLAAPTPVPAALPGMALRALQSRSPIAGFPLAAFLRWTDADATLVRRWRATEPCYDLLLEWFLAGWEHGERPERQWEAALLLVEAGLHTPIREQLSVALSGQDASRAVPWDPAFVRVLASADPPLPDLEQALIDLASKHTDELLALVPALVDGLSAESRRALVDAWIAQAEAAPWERTRGRRALIHLRKPGVSTDALEALLQGITDNDLESRIAAIAPQILREE